MISKMLRKGKRVLGKALLLFGVVSVCLVLITGKSSEVLGQTKEIGQTIYYASLSNIDDKLPDISIAKVVYVIGTPFRAIKEWWMGVEGAEVSFATSSKKRDTSNDVRFEDHLVQVRGQSLGESVSEGVRGALIRGEGFLNEIVESTSINMKEFAEQMCEEMSSDDGVEIIPEYLEKVREEQQGESTGESSESDDLLEEETETAFDGTGEMLEN